MPHAIKQAPSITLKITHVFVRLVILQLQTSQNVTLHATQRHKYMPQRQTHAVAKQITQLHQTLLSVMPHVMHKLLSITLQL